MSKPVSIAVGKQSRSFSDVKVLYTRNAGSDYSGGFTRWVPEDEVELTNKTITENGTYYAEDDGVYGWDTINVSVASDPSAPGSTVIGVDPTDGEEYMIEVGDDGELEKTRLPVRIAVTHPPTKTEYADGETINPTGILVHAYYADDTDYGTVLNSELSYEPTTAEGGSYTPGSIIDIDGVRCLVLNCTGQKSSWYSLGNDSNTYITYQTGGNPAEIWYYVSTSKPCAVYATVYNGRIYFAASVSDVSVQMYLSRTSDGTQGFGTRTAPITPAESDVFYATSYLYSNEVSYLPESTVDPTTAVVPAGGTQTITVKWPRIGDRKVLTSSFDITVQAGISDHSHESGSF